MVVLNRIYTKTGDGGETRLASGEPVSKTDARVAAYGSVDELNAVIGVARLHSGQNDRIDAMLGRIQNELFDLGADLATPHEPPPKWEALRILDSQVARLETEIDWMNESQKPLDSFILPGGSPLSAHLHLARTVCRRAEASDAKNRELIAIEDRLAAERAAPTPTAPTTSNGAPARPAEAYWASRILRWRAASALRAARSAARRSSIAISSRFLASEASARLWPIGRSVISAIEIGWAQMPLPASHHRPLASQRSPGATTSACQANTPPTSTAKVARNSRLSRFMLSKRCIVDLRGRAAR